LRGHVDKTGFLILGGVLALSLLASVRVLGLGSSQAQDDTILSCPQPGKWAISVWSGGNGTAADTALATCGEGAVAAAYYMDPGSQSWLRWFGERPEVSNLGPLDNMQGLIALGGAVAAAGGNLGAAQAGQMLNCPQAGKWSIAVWDGPSGTDTQAALDTCSNVAVDAAFALDPDSQSFSRFFRGRPEVSNLSTLSEHQGVIALGAGGTPSELSFSVDESVVPGVEELPGFGDGAARPVASVADESGNQADFVADELILSTDDPAALDAFLARWEGDVLDVIDPGEYGLADVSPMYVVRINTTLPDASGLEDDLRALGGDGGGHYRVSGQEGLSLLAAWASESEAGSAVDVNWVLSPADLKNRTTTEAPTGSPLPSCSPYSDDAFDWCHLNAGSTQDIGVTEAWRLLAQTDRLKNKVKIAVIDGGFAPDQDTPPVRQTIGAMNTPNTANTEQGNSAPWHGAWVSSAAMAVPDNRFGAAGPAGPVAEALLIEDDSTWSGLMKVLLQAQSHGAKIINISSGLLIPGALGSTASKTLTVLYDIRAAEVLIFASAGNGGPDGIGDDVDVVSSKTGKEAGWQFPCESRGVTCVGALGDGSVANASYSNYGSQKDNQGADGSGTVDIFAPGTVLVGPDPSQSGNYAQWFEGTSAASPYAAGVAALIWAADPGLTATEVEAWLLFTAHNGSGKAKRYVNAFDAVSGVLGSIHPADIHITSPQDGAYYVEGESKTFTANATKGQGKDYGAFNVTWDALRQEDQKAGQSKSPTYLGSGTTLTVGYLKWGTYTITATASYASGWEAQDSIEIIVGTQPTPVPTYVPTVVTPGPTSGPTLGPTSGPTPGPTPTPPTGCNTVLTVGVPRGTGQIWVASTSGCDAGDWILIDAGIRKEECVQIMGEFAGSLWLFTPLEQGHDVEAPVVEVRGCP
jgi:serine protease